MTVSEAELDRAGQVTPRQVARYLRAHGWQPSERYGRSRVWEYRSPQAPEPPYQVLVAEDHELRDYEKRMLDLLEALAHVETRFPAQVLGDLEMPSTDRQFLRLCPPTPSGTAPLVDVVPALIGLKDMMLAAATTADSQREGKTPAPVQFGKRPTRAREFVGSVRLGQTQPGSYILAVQTPIPSDTSQESLRFDDEPAPAALPPYARAVTTFLYTGALTAAAAARLILKRDSTDVLLEEYAAGGVTANFCEGLARLGGEENHEFGLTFEWSPELPMNQPTQPVLFEPRMQQALKAAAAALRERWGQRNALVRGHVVRLLREPRSTDGEITIMGRALHTEDPRPHPFWVRLREADYTRATTAHREGLEVEAVGDLERRSNRTYIAHISDFRTVHSAD